MQTKIALSILAVITFSLGVWFKNPYQQTSDTQHSEDLISFKIYNNRTSDNFETNTKVLNKGDGIKKSTFSSVNIKKESIILQEDHQKKTEQDVLITADIFTGNSSYIGDDTEDNNAGNEGFEDDFPEATFAYDDHAAEGYTNYTESFSD